MSGSDFADSRGRYLVEPDGSRQVWALPGGRPDWATGRPNPGGSHPRRGPSGLRTEVGQTCRVRDQWRRRPGGAVVHALLACACLISGLLAGQPAVSSAAEPQLPIFTEEREAAALTFVRRNYPDLLPLLERVRRSDWKRYQQEICEIFQFCEALTELRAHDERRYQLELERWKTESRALVLVARLSTSNTVEKPNLQAELRDAAKRLVEVDMELLRLRIEELERELGEARDEMNRAEEKRDLRIQERYQFLFDLARRRGMMK